MTHKQLILEALQRHRSDGVCVVEIYNSHRIMRVAARIWDLRSDGHQIDTMDCQDCTGDSRHARYFLAPAQEVMF